MKYTEKKVISDKKEETIVCNYKIMHLALAKYKTIFFFTKTNARTPTFLWTNHDVTHVLTHDFWNLHFQEKLRPRCSTAAATDAADCIPYGWSSRSGGCCTDLVDKINCSTTSNARFCICMCVRLCKYACIRGSVVLTGILLCYLHVKTCKLLYKKKNSQAAPFRFARDPWWSSIDEWNPSSHLSPYTGVFFDIFTRRFFTTNDRTPRVDSENVYVQPFIGLGLLFILCREDWALPTSSPQHRHLTDSAICVGRPEFDKTKTSNKPTGKQLIWTEKHVLSSIKEKQPCDSFSKIRSV